MNTTTLGPQIHPSRSLVDISETEWDSIRLSYLPSKEPSLDDTDAGHSFLPGSLISQISGMMSPYPIYRFTSDVASQATRKRVQARPQGFATTGELLGTASGTAYGDLFIKRSYITIPCTHLYDDHPDQKLSDWLEGDLELGNLHEEEFELKDARAQTSGPAVQPDPSKDENGRRRSMPIVAGGAWSNTTTASRSYSPSGRPRASPTGTSSSSAGGLHTAGTFINTTFMIVLGIAGIVTAILSYQLGKYTAKQGDQSYKLAMWEACVEHADILRNSTKCRQLIAEGFDAIVRGKKVRMKG